MHDEQGNVSVFLVITFSAIICIIFILVDFTRVQNTKNELRRDMFLALESVFAGYNRELKEQYGLFAIRNQEKYEIEEDIIRYLQKNKSKQKLKHYNVMFVNIKESKSIADAKELEMQIKSYMKTRTLDITMQYKTKLEEIFGVLNNGVINQKDIENQKVDPVTEDEYPYIEHYREYDNRKEVEENINYKNSNENDKVVPEKFLELQSISEDIKNNANNFNIEEGKEYLKEELEKFSLENALGKFYIIEYVFKKFNTRINNDFHKDNFFDAEIEFIIEGNKSENENKECVKKRILKIIFPLELKKIYQDSQKLLLAETIAQSVAGWWSSQLGVTICKNLILASMAFENCDIWVTNIVNGGEYYVTPNIKLKYEDFLKIILYMMDKEIILKRIAQLIDINLKTINLNFDINLTHVWIKVKVCVENKFLFMTRSCVPKMWDKSHGFNIYDELCYGY